MVTSHVCFVGPVGAVLVLHARRNAVGDDGDEGDQQAHEGEAEKGNEERPVCLQVLARGNQAVDRTEGVTEALGGGI